jgi:succinate dehydrogenase / fumarate reductase cytochrome b subunit
MGWVGAFWRSSIGKKVVVAVTGLAMVLFLVAHMVGNLKVFIGPEAMNHYAALLRIEPEILPLARVGLLVMVTLHILATVRLTAENRRARGVAYATHAKTRSTTASRTMIFGGIAIALYVVYHLLHFTTRDVHQALVPYDHHNVYANVVLSFQNPLIAGVYILAQVALFFHLTHGIQSAFRTLGVSHPRYLAVTTKGGHALAAIIVLGFMSVPLAVLARIVK